MHPVRKKRLIFVLSFVFVVSAATGLLFYALKDELNLFYTPTQIANKEAPPGQKIRAGGMVVEGSFRRLDDSLQVIFEVTDYESTLTVTYQGILPNLFAEKEGVVVTGRLNDEGLFVADEVMAKHDENYMPPELQDTLKSSDSSVTYKNK
ncbi:MAG: cytochrome c maturation protein CcmE [Cellvibrionales bacterium]|nr:cytochrome c maturation protein CcmE [Cellvibrionales bacterium]